MSVGLYQYDPDLGFSVRPYSQGTNRFGFNDRDYGIDKEEGVYRILVIGDSFNWAGGREENYTALLEDAMEAHFGSHRVDVINAGYPMTHTGEQLAILQKFGLQYSPDLVVVGFFAGNDFIDADPNRKRIVINDTYYDIDRRYELRAMGYPIVFKSRLWHFIKQRLVVWRSIEKGHAQDSPVAQGGATGSDTGTFEEKVFLEIEKYRLDFCHLPSYHAGKYAANIDYILETFSQMKLRLDNVGAGLVVAIFPDEFQVNENLLSQLFRTYGLQRDQYETELAQRLLREHLDSCNITYIDFLDAFRVKGEQEPLYLKRDTHWNRSGNMLAADILFQFLIPRLEDYFFNSTMVAPPPPSPGGAG